MPMPLEATAVNSCSLMLGLDPACSSSEWWCVQGPTVCFMMANTTVVQQPLHLENFTAAITQHAVRFLQTSTPWQPWFFFMAYFHVHTPLFTNRANRGRSRGGTFGDNVEELDDSVGVILAALDEGNFTDNTL